MEAMTKMTKQRAILAKVEALSDSVRELVADAKAENTRRAYRADWQRFSSWCEDHGLEALPASPEALALYIAARAEEGRKLSTIKRELVAISQAHQTAGKDSPTSAMLIKEMIKGLARMRAMKGERTKKAPALRPDHIRAMVATMDFGTLRGIRDRALLLVGFAGAFRRAELVALLVEDLSFEPEGVRIQVRRSKSDQAGKGRTFGIAYGLTEELCPVQSLKSWLKAGRIETGPIFRSFDQRGELTKRHACARSVDRILKKTAADANLSLSISAHSLRTGMITSAIARGARPEQVRAISGHRSQHVFSGYIQMSSIWIDNPTVCLF